MDGESKGGCRGWMRGGKVVDRYSMGALSASYKQTRNIQKTNINT